MKKNLAKKIKSYTKRYNTSSYRSKKIVEAMNLIENRKIVAVYPRIKSYKIFVIKGKRGTYVTIKNLYCSCIGFTAALMKNRIRPCYHLIAVEMANEDQIRKIYIEPEKFYNLILMQELDSMFQS